MPSIRAAEGSTDDLFTSARLHSARGAYEPHGFVHAAALARPKPISADVGKPRTEPPCKETRSNDGEQNTTDLRRVFTCGTAVRWRCSRGADDCRRRTY